MHVLPKTITTYLHKMQSSQSKQFINISHNIIQCNEIKQKPWATSNAFIRNVTCES